MNDAAIPNRRAVPNYLIYALIVAGTGGTAASYVRADHADTRAGISQEEATRAIDARSRYENLLQHCQERESDRMWQLIHGSKP